MKKIDTDKVMLVLRVNNYKNYNFVNEHRKLMEEYNTIWMFKVGRPLAQKSIDILMKNGGYVILKEPKASGNRYYICISDEIRQGKPNEKMIYPDYYKELYADGISMEGTWLRISEINEISKEALPYFELSKSHKKMTDVVNSTRSPILYVETMLPLSIENGVAKKGIE